MSPFVSKSTVAQNESFGSLQIITHVPYGYFIISLVCNPIPPGVLNGKLIISRGPNIYHVDHLVLKFIVGGFGHNLLVGRQVL